MSTEEMTSPDGEGHLTYEQMLAANEQLIEKYGEDYVDKIGGAYTHSDGTHCYVGALFEELGYPLPNRGKDYANGSAVGGIKSWLEKNHGVSMNQKLQRALQAAQVKNDTRQTWGSAADAFMQSYRKSRGQEQLKMQNVNQIDLGQGETSAQQKVGTGQKIWED
jgi:DNA polymerase I-like protein with 3'-5' exonuclease and polymerase domains